MPNVVQKPWSAAAAELRQCAGSAIARSLKRSTTRRPRARCSRSRPSRGVAVPPDSMIEGRGAARGAHQCVSTDVTEHVVRRPRRRRSRRALHRASARADEFSIRRRQSGNVISSIADAAKAGSVRLGHQRHRVEGPGHGARPERHQPDARRARRRRSINDGFSIATNGSFEKQSASCRQSPLGTKVRSADSKGTSSPRRLRIGVICSLTRPTMRPVAQRRSRAWVHSTDASRSSPARAAAWAASTRCCSRAEGAKVVVNDLGGDMHGEGGDPSPAMETVADIKAMGGEAVVNGDNVADWDGAQRLVQQAVDTYGDLDVLVNNAGHPARPGDHQHDRGGVGRGRRRALEGSLRADAPRGRVLAGTDEGRQGGEGVDHPHDVDVGAVREPGPSELRRREERYRNPFAGVREGVGALRRAVERDRARALEPGSRWRRRGSATR